MLNLISLLIGGVSLLLTLLAFLPFFGWANWFILPLPVIGLAIGALSGGSKSGRNLNLVVIVIGVLRLMLGGGIF
jgi:hypothetical protein